MTDLNDLMKNLKNIFKDKVVWITGGGSGIGSSLAVSLAELGAKVVISSRSEKDLKEVADVNENIIPIPMDVSSNEDWDKALKTFNEKFSSLDIMIFNAGTCEYIDLPEFQSTVFEKVFAVNFMGIVKGLEKILPSLLKTHRSRVVAVTSSVAALPLPRAEAYGASKAAATYLMDSLRLGLDELGIDVSVVMPGFVSTPLTDKNDFPMPFKISSDEAAFRIIKGIAANKKHIFFPGRFTWPLRFLGVLPITLQQLFTRRFSR